uniref:Uncharacterized protein n=1 Tax=Strombidium rassoulzadegani TaxID=1082188 RepID=A0A7S3CMI4_9SPIT|mmetsp:Transcript_17412/g.29298  ORF Transcript_17412/g.29298 Transcript_17412/m.29298 type:complete len:202 (+) Transcript_17412:509-1114(+)
MESSKVVLVDFTSFDPSDSMEISKAVREYVTPQRLESTLVNVVLKDLQVPYQYTSNSIYSRVDRSYRLIGNLVPVQSNQVFGPIFLPQRADAEKPYQGFLVLEYDHNNMRTQQEAVDPREFSVDNILRVFSQRATRDEFLEEASDEEDEAKREKLQKELKERGGAAKNLEVLKQVTMKSQLAETFMKQVAFKLGKFAKFGA